MVKSPKTQGKTSKLKEKTQNSRKKLKLSEFWYSPSLQTGVKKMPGLDKFLSLDHLESNKNRWKKPALYQQHISGNYI